MPPSSATRCSCRMAARRAPTSPAAMRARSTARSSGCWRCRRDAPVHVPRLRPERPRHPLGDHRRRGARAQHPCPRRHQRGRVRRDARGARRDARHAAADHPVAAGEHAGGRAAAAGRERQARSSRCRSTRSEPHEDREDTPWTSKRIDRDLSVAPQIRPTDVAEIAAAGFESIICNRPGRRGRRPADLRGDRRAAAKAAGLEVALSAGRLGQGDATRTPRPSARRSTELPKPVLAYCRTGTRSATLWSLSEAARGAPLPEILAAHQGGGLRHDRRRPAHRQWRPHARPTPADATHEVVIVGGGAAGIAVAASLLARKPDLDIAIIDPADIHYYQPGWTMVGGGVFDPRDHGAHHGARSSRDGVKWIKAAVAAFEPENNAVILDGCRVVNYKPPDRRARPQARLGRHRGAVRDARPQRRHLELPLRPGALHLGAGAGPEARHGRCSPSRRCRSNAPARRRRRCISRPTIGCAAACSTDIEVEFCNAGGVLFGVQGLRSGADGIRRSATASQLNFHHNLIAIDGPGAQRLVHAHRSRRRAPRRSRRRFDMIHVVPAADRARFHAGLAAGRRSRLGRRRPGHAAPQDASPNIYGLGDACNAPNAKTAAAARKQAPVVAENVLLDMGAAQAADAHL